MNKLFKKFTYILGFAAAFLAAGCSDDIADEITSLDVSRLFSPVGLETRIVNQTGVRLTWNTVNKATSYNIEVYEGLDFSGTPVQKANVTYDEVPYTMTGFDGETSYVVRVQAIGAGIDDSKWTNATFKTDAEQIFKAVDGDELEATSVVLRWIPGQVATTIVFTVGTHDDYTVTADDIAAGAATITGLTGETAYTVKLMNGTKTRGTVSFETPIDLGGAIPVYPEDDLKAKLDGATEGDVFALFPGTYALGEYTMTKSVILTGVRPNNKPIVQGRFKCASAVSKLKLTNVVLDGTNTVLNIFEVASGCNLTSIELTSCEVRNYTRALFYNNSSGTTVGSISMSDCIVTDILGDGGDGIDFRTGTLNSLTIEKSTFNNGFRSFLRIQTTTNISIRQCTLYKISMVDNKDNSGLFRSSTGGTFEVKSCLFVETGKEAPANASVGNFIKTGNIKGTESYDNNYYYSCHNLWVGVYTKPADVKCTEGNPGFKDAAKGDFTISNDDMIAKNVGDPRWIK